jgi:sugar/nucleoside kinase (ribokinase family)
VYFSGSGIVCIGNLLADGIGHIDESVAPLLAGLGNPAHIGPETMAALLDEIETRTGKACLHASETSLPRGRSTEGLAWSIGGGPAITAMATAALGLEAEVWACTGQDARGDSLEKGLIERRVGVAREYSRLPTGVFLSLESTSGRRIVVSPGAARDLQGRPFPASLLRAGWFLHIDGLLIEDPVWLDHLARQALDAGMRLSLDLSTPGNAAAHGSNLLKFAITFCDIVFANAGEWQALGLAWPEDCTSAASLQMRMVDRPLCRVLKRGAQGARLVIGKERHEAKGIPAPVVDETGAGDVFAAAFIAAVLEGRTPAASLEAANSTAAVSVSCLGSGFSPGALRAAFMQ